MSTVDAFGNPVILMLDRTARGYSVGLSHVGAALSFAFAVLLIAIVAGVWVQVGERRVRVRTAVNPGRLRRHIRTVYSGEASDTALYMQELARDIVTRIEDCQRESVSRDSTVVGIALLLRDRVRIPWAARKTMREAARRSGQYPLRREPPPGPPETIEDVADIMRRHGIDA